MKKIMRIILSICLGIIACSLCCIVLKYQRTSSTRLENKFDQIIEQFHSSVDFNDNGIDDQMDILQGALEYTETQPKYKSKYYQTGYPNDEYGTCTDAVAFAMKNAGYDLMALVAEDINDNREAYAVDEPDPNIDFRRVKNLKVYFRHTAISLTLDITDIDQWQGGDVVIFENHIGIISDRRNPNGVPYVIHHNSPMQASYEEDILETRNDIAGHYRVSE